MKVYVWLANFIYIVLCGFLVLTDTMLVRKHPIMVFLCVGLLYITLWLLLSLWHKNKTIIKPLHIWIAMIPNLLVAILLLINSYVVPMDFISGRLAGIVLLSIIVIPIMFTNITEKERKNI